MSKVNKELEYAQGLLVEAVTRKDRVSGALTVRKRTVRNYWDFLAGMKGAMSHFSRMGKSTSPLRVLYREKLADLQEHEMMVKNLRAMYKEASDEVWVLQNMVKKLEGECL